MIGRQQVIEILSHALPGHSLKSFEPLTAGMSNLNYLLLVEGLEDRFVLRLYARDPAACEKEMALYHLLFRKVPMPEIVGVDAIDEGGDCPWMLKRYVEGSTFQELKSRGNDRDTARAAYAIGAILAQMQPISFPEPFCGGIASAFAVTSKRDSRKLAAAGKSIGREFLRRMPRRADLKAAFGCAGKWKISPVPFGLVPADRTIEAGENSCTWRLQRTEHPCQMPR